MVTGRLDVVTLESILQVAEWERWTGRLTLPLGDVTFLVGIPVQARFQEHRGTDALLEHFLHQTGEFELEHCSVRGDPPLGRTTELVMEGVRRRDDWNDLASRVLRGSIGDLSFNGRLAVWEHLREDGELCGPKLWRIREGLAEGLLLETGKPVPVEPLVDTTRAPVVVEDTRPSLWVMTEDPAIDQPAVNAALGRLEREGINLVFAHPETRESQLAALRSGRLGPPWVLLFGDMHVLLGDQMLRDLGCCGELSRLLLSTHLNGELLQTTANFCGLDQSLTLPQSEDDIVDAVHRMVERTQRLRSHKQSA